MSLREISDPPLKGVDTIHMGCSSTFPSNCIINFFLVNQINRQILRTKALLPLYTLFEKFPGGPGVKTLTAVRAQVQSLGREVPRATWHMVWTENQNKAKLLEKIFTAFLNGGGSKKAGQNNSEFVYSFIHGISLLTET